MRAEDIVDAALAKLGSSSPVTPAATSPDPWEKAERETSRGVGDDLSVAWSRLTLDQVAELLGGDYATVNGERIEGPCAAARGKCDGGKSNVAFLYLQTGAHAGVPPKIVCQHKGSCGAAVSAFEVIARRFPSRGDAAEAIKAKAGLVTTKGSVPTTGEAEHLTDLGNAHRLVRLHGENMRHSDATEWLVWDGRRWRRDDTGEVDRRAQDVPREIRAEALETERRAVAAVTSGEREELEEKADALRKWAKTSEGEPGLRRMVKLARRHARVAIRIADLDRDPWALNLLNGTLDLQTGAIRAHDRADLVTKLAGATFDERAEAPLWAAFLKKATGGSEQLEHFLARLVGYCLTGSTREQAFFLLYGTGSNGKSVFVEAVRALLGDYATGAQFASFMAQRRNGSGPSEDIARLRGARLVSAIESKDSGRLDEGLVKQLTGGDVVVARELNKGSFEFVPTFKIMLAANARPKIRGTDHGIWRRVRLVPFTATIPDEDQDKDLGAKLAAELPGLLRWALDGCLAWHRDGLGVPAEVAAATSDYRESQQEPDTFPQFIEDECVLASAATVEATEIWKRYVAWAAEGGETPLRRKQFVARLESEEGVERTRTTAGRSAWNGLRLVAPKSPKSAEVKVEDRSVRARATGKHPKQTSADFDPSAVPDTYDPDAWED